MQADQRVARRPTSVFCASLQSPGNATAPSRSIARLKRYSFDTRSKPKSGHRAHGPSDGSATSTATKFADFCGAAIAVTAKAHTNVMVLNFRAQAMQRSQPSPSCFPLGNRPRRVEPVPIVAATLTAWDPISRPARPNFTAKHTFTTGRSQRCIVSSRAQNRCDTRVRLLTSIPGVGAIVSLSFTAAIDDPARFKSSRQIGAYFGLTAGQ